jgi:hypothetical protein
MKETETYAIAQEKGNKEDSGYDTVIYSWDLASNG